MRLFRRLAVLNATEWLLLAEAVVAVPTMRLALTVLPFRFLQGAISGMARRGRPRVSPTDSPEQIAQMVNAVADRVPHATCLTRALAATLLLTRRGHTPTLRLGVARNDDGSLRAHAWLDCSGRTILGGSDAGEFVLFPPVSLSHR